MEKNANKLRILFVDNEQYLLDGIQELLRKHRHIWKMYFALGGEKALTILGSVPIDIVITDLHMPVMDGIELLMQVKKKYPKTIRFMLSGNVDIDKGLKTISIAHQYLTKPCNLETFEKAITQVCCVKDSINYDALCELVGGLDRLPNVPKVYMKLTQILQQESVCLDDIVKILEQDMALCARILQVVNSSFFRRSRPITRIDEAANYLGIDLIKNITLSAEIFNRQENYPKIEGLSREDIQSHAQLTAAIASQIVTQKAQANDAYLSGIIHNIGLLALSVGSPKRLSEALSVSINKGCPLHVIEEQLYEVNHGLVGAYLLSLWGLPYHITEAVANHHTPTRLPSEGFGLLHSVYIAQILASEVMEPDFDSSTEIDLDYLAKLGVADRLDSWRALARQQLQ